MNRLLWNMLGLIVCGVGVLFIFNIVVLSLYTHYYTIQDASDFSQLQYLVDCAQPLLEG